MDNETNWTVEQMSSGHRKEMKRKIEKKIIEPYFTNIYMPNRPTDQVSRKLNALLKVV